MCFTRAMHFSAGAQLVVAQQVAGRLELVQHELQPQLGGLVLDDEQQFVVVLRPLRRALRTDSRVSQVEVAAVAHAVAEVGDDRCLDRAGVRLDAVAHVLVSCHDLSLPTRVIPGGRVGAPAPYRDLARRPDTVGLIG